MTSYNISIAREKTNEILHWNWDGQVLMPGIGIKTDTALFQSISILNNC